MVDFSKVKTVPLSQRKSLVTLKDFIKPTNLECLIKNDDLASLANDIKTARVNNKEVLWMMGAHSIKLGLSPYIIDLMKQGYITHIAMNGAGPVHDFEIAYAGHTSEIVADGTFGVAEETGRMINEAVKERSGEGFGYAVSKMIHDNDLTNKFYSILYWAHHLKIPLTVHTAIGTDIIYEHPSCDGAAIGRASYEDFKKLTSTISRLDEGVVLNVGSAVVLPEVFLKALAVARNLGYSVKNFTAANLDMIDHYRPRTNVLKRPTSLGGKNYNIIARHEHTIPTLCYYLLGRES
ncbi:MAG: hypothetical protein QW404_03190 [Candidatus Nanoarchaeia archaeon]